MKHLLTTSILLFSRLALAQVDYVSAYQNQESRLRLSAGTILEFFLVLDNSHLTYFSKDSPEHDFAFPYTYADRLKLISGRTVHLHRYDLGWSPVIVDIGNGYAEFSETRPPGGGGYTWALALFKTKDHRNFIAVTIGHGAGINLQPNFRVLEYTSPHFRDVTAAVVPKLTPAMFRPSACEVAIMKHSPPYFGLTLPLHGTTIQAFCFVQKLQFSACARTMGILERKLLLRWNDDKGLFEF